MFFALYGRNDAGRFGYLTQAGDLDPLGVAPFALSEATADDWSAPALPPSSPPFGRLAVVDYPDQDPRAIARRAGIHLLAAARADRAAWNGRAAELEEAFAAFAVALHRLGVDAGPARELFDGATVARRPGAATAAILGLLGDGVTVDDIDPIRAELARLAREGMARRTAPARYYLTGEAAECEWAALLAHYDRHRAP